MDWHHDFYIIFFLYIPSNSKFPNYINSKNNKRITSISLFKSCSQIKVLIKQNQALPDDQDSISILTISLIKKVNFNGGKIQPFL